MNIRDNLLARLDERPNNTAFLVATRSFRDKIEEKIEKEPFVTVGIMSASERENHFDQLASFLQLLTVVWRYKYRPIVASMHATVNFYGAHQRFVSGLVNFSRGSFFLADKNKT